MSDFFGIGNAFRAMAKVYMVTARQSGRTMSLVESLNDGDRVWFTTDREARHVQRMCKERGVKIEARVTNPGQPQKVFDYPPARGKVIFDHSWVEQFYLSALENADRCISEWQIQSGHADGEGLPHLETRYKAGQRRRWDI